METFGCLIFILLHSIPLPSWLVLEPQLSLETYFGGRPRLLVRDRAGLKSLLPLVRHAQH